MGSIYRFVHEYAHPFFLSQLPVKALPTLNVSGYCLVTSKEWDAKKFQKFTRVST